MLENDEFEIDTSTEIPESKEAITRSFEFSHQFGQLDIQD